jgi:tetratricopeptide (TPR) repeat protein
MSDSPASKIDNYIDKGWENFGDATGVVGDERTRLMRKAITYLSMAEQLNPTDDNNRRFIFGLSSLCFAFIDEWEKSKQYQKLALAIDPQNFWAKVAAHFTALNVWGNHRGFVAQGDGSMGGLFAVLITAGASKAVDNSKRNNVLNTAIEAANAYQYYCQTAKNPSAYGLYLRSWLLKSIAETLWENKLRDRRICDILLATPWDKVDPDTIGDAKEFEDSKEDFEVDIRGLLAMIK